MSIASADIISICRTFLAAQSGAVVVERSVGWTRGAGVLVSGDASSLALFAVRGIITAYFTWKAITGRRNVSLIVCTDRQKKETEGIPEN